MTSTNKRTYLININIFSQRKNIYLYYFIEKDEDTHCFRYNFLILPSKIETNNKT
jgi:hypothetical protein